jgi:hypothetical protein
MKLTTEEAWARRDAALRCSARVDLLFGPGSGAASSASGLLNRLAVAATDLQPPTLNAEGAERALVAATGYLQEFRRSAFDGIRRGAPPSAALRESLFRSLGRRSAPGM